MSGKKKKEVPCCDICTLEDDKNAEDKMLRCTLCKVTVHAGCYSAEEPAKKEWFCFPCNTGFKPDQLICAVCNRSGGAFKKVLGDSKTWAHAVCVNWIPEIDEVDDEGKDMGPRVDLSLLDESRKKLQCTVCNQKGKPCVQCAYKNCLAAVHPICLMKDTYDFVFRVVEGYNKSAKSAYYRREAYCPRHADFVGQPLKNGEMVIQLPCYTKFEVGDDYTPVLKDEFAGTVVPFPTITASDSAANTPVAKKKGAGGASSASDNAGKVGQKRGRSSADSAPASPEPASLSSKRPKGTVAKATSTSGKLQISPGRAQSGAKGGSTASVSSASSRGKSPAPAPPRESIYDIVERASMSAQKKNTRAPAVPLRARKDGPPGFSVSTGSVPAAESTPKRATRSSAPEDLLVPPSPSLVSIASPEQHPKSTRGSQASAATEPSVPATPVSTVQSTGASAAAGVGSSAFRQVATNAAAVQIPVRTPSFSPSAGIKEDRPPVPPAVKKNDLVQQPDYQAAAVPASTGSSSSAAAPAPAAVSALVPAPMSATVTAASAVPATSGAPVTSVAGGAVVDAPAVQQLQALLRQVLLGMLPPPASAPSSSGEDLMASAQETPKYRLGPSSLPEDTWADLSEADWLCLTSSAAGPSRRRSGPSSTCSSEEIFVTPGTLLTSDDVVNFSELQLKENLQYFNSLGAFRIHLAQNSCLLQPWVLTWQDLQDHHGWRAHYSSSTHVSSPADDSVHGPAGASGESSDSAMSAPELIYLCADAGSSGRDEGTDSDGDCASTRRGVSSGGAGVKAPVFVDNCIDGVHRFKTWRELQCYIHKYPYLLQNDATLTNTLLINGWRHRLRVKPENSSTSTSPSRQSHGHGNNNEFLWQGAHLLPHVREDIDLTGADVENDCRDGVWLGIDALRRHLWVEPTRLFRPYDRALSAIRVTAANMPSIVSASVDASAGSRSRAAVAGADGAQGIQAVQAEVHASESDVKQLRSEFSTLLAEVAALKQSNAESQSRCKKLESKLERQRERKREKRDRRRSGAVDSIAGGLSHSNGRAGYAYAHGPGQGQSDDDQELGSDYEQGEGDGDTV